MRRTLVVISCCLAVLGGSYLAFVHYTEPYQAAIVWDRVSGELRLDDQAGFDVTAPWVAVSRIDTRPVRVCITSAGRGFNCKLVRFDPAAYKEFVAVQGFHYYWFANRFSFNSGYDDEYRGMKDLLRGYAFGVKKYPFVTVLKDSTEQ
jgi:hypothetical protein